MKALDLYCGAGGAGVGIHRAGFDVTGCDIRPQPNYPFVFILGDALEQSLEGFDFVWASPPCQRHTGLNCFDRSKYEDLIEATRDKLTAWGGPWIMENVPGAPLRNPLKLSGEQFGLRVKRPRIFESNIFLFHPPDVRDPRKTIRKKGDGGHFYRVYGHEVGSVMERGEAMGIDWMTDREELSESIPPAFSEFLCTQVLRILRRAA